MAILGTIIGKGAVRMEAHERVLHELLKMGEMLLGCGAEINRVEDTMTRLGRAYGAKKVDIFAITSDIVLTILFEDGVELTQTRRIRKSSSFDFVKLEQLNAHIRRRQDERREKANFLFAFRSSHSLAEHLREAQEAWEERHKAEKK